MKKGDRVQTPDGPGTIADILEARKEWHGSGRKPVRRGPYAIIDYGGRRRHVWAFDKIRPLKEAKKL